MAAVSVKGLLDARKLERLQIHFFSDAFTAAVVVVVVD